MMTLRPTPLTIVPLLCCLALSASGTTGHATLTKRGGTGNTDAPTQQRLTERPPEGNSPTVTAPSTSPSPDHRESPEITVVAAGDVLLHNALWAQATADAKAAGRSGYDFRPLFSEVESIISSADLAICHLETVVGPSGGPFSGYPRFVVPPQIIPALKQVGYDGCSTASNHSLDDGERGIRRTLTAMDAAGLAHSGTARSAAEAAHPTIVTVRGVRIALLSYTFSFNGLRLPSDQAWLANDLGADALLDEAKRARAAGAEIVIASVHWGVEYSQTASPAQTKLAKRFLASPNIDLVLGHHAHVVQPFERIGGKWVVYSMGNHVARQPQRETTQDGVIAKMTFRRVADRQWRTITAEGIPTRMDLFGVYDAGAMRLVSIPAVLSDRSISPYLRHVCNLSLDRTKAALTARGAASDGLIIRQSQTSR